MGHPARLGNRSYVKNETNLVTKVSDGHVDFLKLLLECNTGLSKVETDKKDHRNEFETGV